MLLQLLPAPSYGVVKGTIKNISSKNFKDVIIIYQSGSDTIRASVGNLNKGQETEFRNKSDAGKYTQPRL